MYFKQFPVIPYENSDDSVKIVTNLLRRISVKEKVRESSILYDTYDIKDGEMPEHLAHKLYGDAELHWIILLINNITDVYRDWPMSYTNFLRFVTDKYDNPDAIHHYIIYQSSGKDTVKINIGLNDKSHYEALGYTVWAVTNSEHEEEIQEKKRKIKLLDDRYIELFRSNFKQLISERMI